MNTERLKRLAARLDKLPPAKFNMMEPCDCIAGQALRMAHILGKVYQNEVLLRAQHYLDLTFGDAVELFNPSPFPYGAGPKTAARAVRSLIRTGDVRWPSARQ